MTDKHDGLTSLERRLLRRWAYHVTGYSRLIKCTPSRVTDCNPDDILYRCDFDSGGSVFTSWFGLYELCRIWRQAVAQKARSSMLRMLRDEIFPDTRRYI